MSRRFLIHVFLILSLAACAAAFAAAGPSGRAASPDEAVIRSVYRAMSAESEDGPRFEPSDFRTYLPAEFTRVLLESAISPPEEKAEASAVEDDGSAGRFPRPDGGPSLEGPWARPGATLADLAAWYRELFPSIGTGGIRAVTSFQVTVRSSGSGRDYRAAFVWFAPGPSRDAADQQFVLVDHQATALVESIEVDFAAAPGLALEEAGAFDPEGSFAAAGALACHRKKSKFPYEFRTETGTESHGSGSIVFHRANAKVNLICVCHESCQAQGKVRWKDSFCGDWNNLFDVKYTSTDDDGSYHVSQPKGGQRGTVETIVDRSLDDSTRAGAGAAFLCTLKKCQDRSCAVSSSVSGSASLNAQGGIAGISFTHQREVSPAMIWTNTDQKITRSCEPCERDEVGVCEPDKEDCFDPDCACRAPLKCSPTLRRCVQSCGDGVIDPGENCVTCPADFRCNEINTVCNQQTGACQQCSDPCASDGFGTKCNFWTDRACSNTRHCGNCETVPNAVCDRTSNRCNANRICISNCQDLDGTDLCGTFRYNSCGQPEFCMCQNPGNVCSGNRCVPWFPGAAEIDCSMAFAPDVARVPAAGSSEMAVDVTSSCGWTAAASVPWIRLTGGATGSSQGSVFYMVDSNPEDLPRQGSVLINDQSFDVTQDGSVCAPVLAPGGATVSAAGVENTVQVAANCAWTAVSEAPWLQIVSGQSTVGAGSFRYRALAYQGSVSRTAKIRVGATDFVLVQQADPNGAGCQSALNPPSAQVGSGGALGYVINLETSSSGCKWLAQSHTPWIRVISASEGQGSGPVEIDVEANPSSSPRAGVLTIAGRSYQVNQDGVPCVAAVSPGQLIVPSRGATDLGVTVSSLCSWQTGLIPWWITLKQSVPGEEGYVLLDVAANTAGTPRSGSFLVAGQSVRIDQEACTSTNSLLPTSASVGPAGATGLTTKLTVPGGCAWTAGSNASWLTRTSAASGAGSATVTYNVAALGSNPARTGTLSIGGVTFTVTQDNACSFSIAPASNSFGSGGGTGSVSLTGKIGCTWSAVSGASWITITQGTSGNGSATVSYSVAAN